MYTIRRLSLALTISVALLTAGRLVGSMSSVGPMVVDQAAIGEVLWTGGVFCLVVSLASVAFALLPAASPPPQLHRVEHSPVQDPVHPLD